MYFAHFTPLLNCKLCIRICLCRIIFRCVCSCLWYFCLVYSPSLCGCIVSACPLRPVREFPCSDAGWGQSVESSNWMFPCIYAKLITAKQNCKATFHSLSNLEVILVLLWVYRSLDPCSAIYTDSAVSCSSLNRTRVMFFAFVRPHASVCEDSTARFCRTFKANPTRCHCHWSI